METRIKVIARCRPLVGDENRTGRRCLSITEDVISVGDKRFAFEHVYDESSTQKQIYDNSIRSLVEGCFEGFNATVFAYGQTGSGKTHSIMGSPSTDDDDAAGIIPRAIQQVFDYLRSDKAAGRTANVRISMIELYNDECKDLLHPEIPSRDIMIREDKLGRIFFTGAREEIVSNAATTLQFVEQGNLHRTTAETLMNQNSSRSHAIFTISLEMLEFSKDTVTDTETENSLIQAKLHLIDLAGSERAKRTGAIGTRFKESVGINQGLLALGKVIRALTSTPPSQHVPYRESKLTRFLQDSLGGNSNTMLLACISPLESNLHETISSLQYAQRAKAIQNRLTANVSAAGANLELRDEVESALVVSLRAEIVRLQQMEREKKSKDERVSEGEREGETRGEKERGRNGSGDRERMAQCVQTMRRCVTALRGALESERDRERDEDALRRAARESVAMLDESVRNAERERERERDMTSSLTALRSSLQLVEWERERERDRESGTDRERERDRERDKESDSLRALREDYERELDALRDELRECRDDLQRDEEIFAEKMKELKATRKALRDLQAEHESEREKLAKLLAMPLSPQRQRQRERENGNEREKETERETDDLDLSLSLAVALTEPDVSQLLEDVETLSREKRDLLSARAQSEQSIENAQRALKDEQERAAQREKALRDELLAEREQMEKIMHALASDRERGGIAEEMREKERKESERERETWRFRERALCDEIAALRDELQREREKETERAREREIEQKRRESERETDIETSLALSLDAPRVSLFLDARLAELEARALSRVEALRLSKALALLHSERESAEKELRTQSALVARSEREIERLLAVSLARSPSRVSIERDREREREKEREAERERVNAQFAQLEEKIKTLRLKASNAKMRMQRAKEIEGESESATDRESARERARREYSDAQFTLESYEEHRRELVSRLRAAERERESEKKTIQSAREKESEKERDKEKEKETRVLLEKEKRVREDALVVVQDLDEDLDALRTEIAATQQRLDAERERLAKARPARESESAKERETEDENESLDKQIDALFAQLNAFALNALSQHSNNPPHTPNTLTQRDASLSLSSSQRTLSARLAERLVKLLLQQLLSQRVQSGSAAHAARAAQQQLERKCADYDALVQTMQRARNDALRRQEQLKRENEEKIAFLVQQMRVLEGKSTTTTTASTAAFVERLHSPAMSRGSTPQSSARTVGNGDDSPHAVAVRPHSSVSKRNMTELLQQQLHHHGQGEKAHAAEINNEVLQRYAAEKERREQLEKRNIELAKELRALRSVQR